MATSTQVFDAEQDDELHYADSDEVLRITNVGSYSLDTADGQRLSLVDLADKAEKGLVTVEKGN